MCMEKEAENISRKCLVQLLIHRWPCWYEINKWTFAQIADTHTAYLDTAVSFLACAEQCYLSRLAYLITVHVAHILELRDSNFVFGWMFTKNQHPEISPYRKKKEMENKVNLMRNFVPNLSYLK